jgi:hypothetical protein
VIARIASIAIAAALLAVPAAAQLFVNKRAVLAQPVVLGPGQGAVIVGFRRPDSLSAGKSGLLRFSRYDRQRRDLSIMAKDARKNGDTTTYSITVKSSDRKLALDHAVMLVSAGDYVLAGAAPGPVTDIFNTFCFGAPTFRVNAGETVYFGDITPYLGVRMQEPGTTALPSVMGITIGDDTLGNAMAYSSHPDDARAALANQPALAAGFKPAELRNGATYGCFGQDMTAYIVPSAPDLPVVAVATPATAASEAAAAPKPPAHETPFD